MISFINIILSDQKMNEYAISMSSHNLKLNHYEELILLSQYENFYCFHFSHY